MNINEILDMRTQELDALIRSNIGPDGDAALWDLLKDPEVILTTEKILTNISMDIDGQLGQRKAARDAFLGECHRKGAKGKKEWFDYEEDYNGWRAAALGFKRFVRGRITEVSTVKAIAAQRAGAIPPSSGRGTAMHKHNGDALLELTAAVLRHRAETTRQGIKPEQHDLDLWKALEQLTAATSKGTMPLHAWCSMVREKQNTDSPS